MGRYGIEDEGEGISSPEAPATPCSDFTRLPRHADALKTWSSGHNEGGVYEYSQVAILVLGIACWAVDMFASVVRDLYGCSVVPGLSCHTLGHSANNDVIRLLLRFRRSTGGA